MIIIPGQSGTYRHSRRRVTDLLAESGLIEDERGILPPGGEQAIAAVSRTGPLHGGKDLVGADIAAAQRDCAAGMRYEWIHSGSSRTDMREHDRQRRASTAR
jgi:hypothetical protein